MPCHCRPVAAAPSTEKRSALSPGFRCSLSRIGFGKVTCPLLVIVACITFPRNPYLRVRLQPSDDGIKRRAGGRTASRVSLPVSGLRAAGTGRAAGEAATSHGRSSASWPTSRLPLEASPSVRPTRVTSRAPRDVDVCAARAVPAPGSPVVPRRCIVGAKENPRVTTSLRMSPSRTTRRSTRWRRRWGRPAPRRRARPARRSTASAWRWPPAR